MACVVFAETQQGDLALDCVLQLVREGAEGRLAPRVPAEMEVEGTQAQNKLSWALSLQIRCWNGDAPSVLFGDHQLVMNTTALQQEANPPPNLLAMLSCESQPRGKNCSLSSVVSPILTTHEILYECFMG